VAEWAKDGIQTVVLQIGDFDAKGLSIYRAFEADVCAFARSHGAAGMVTFKRLAVTPEQVDHYDLERDPPKLPKDNKLPPGPPLPYNTQAEALNPEQLAEVVTSALKHYLDPRVRAVAQSRSERERRTVLDAIEGIELPA
jgi:hypothetical protein